MHLEGPSGNTGCFACMFFFAAFSAKKKLYTVKRKGGKQINSCCCCRSPQSLSIRLSTSAARTRPHLFQLHLSDDDDNNKHTHFFVSPPHFIIDGAQWESKASRFLLAM